MSLKHFEKFYNIFTYSMNWFTDGISFKEARNVARVLPDISRKQLLSAFKKIDINGDGFITDTELYKILTSVSFFVFFK